MEQILDDVLLGKSYEDFFPVLTDEFSLPLVVPKNLISIQKEGLLLPCDDFFDRLLQKQQFINFILIYEIYFEEIRESHSTGKFLFFTTHYFINVMYLSDLSKSSHRKVTSVEIKRNKEDVQQLAAIARTAMLNYHQSHNITNLPKVQFIQQK